MKGFIANENSEWLQNDQEGPPIHCTVELAQAAGKIKSKF